MTPRILLLQARLPDDPMRGHELRCFVERTGLPPEAVVAHDLCESLPVLAEVRRQDALMIGGSGDFYVTRGNLPRFDGFLDLLREVVELDHPTFASCYGFGALVQALGGTMVHDPEHREVGTFELELTPEGAGDPLFESLPPRFWAQMGHQDRADALTDDLTHLCRGSKHCPYQAIRVRGKRIWSTQFHPELDREANTERFRNYLRTYGYAEDSIDLDDALDAFRDSPEASGLLRRFLSLNFGWKP